MAIIEFLLFKLNISHFICNVTLLERGVTGLMTANMSVTLFFRDCGCVILSSV